MKENIENAKINRIVELIRNDHYFANTYKFNTLEVVDLFSLLKLQLKDFDMNGFVYCIDRNLLISAISDNEIYISTKGLVTRPIPKGKNIYYAFKSQAKIMEMILEELIKLSSNKYIYFVGGETFEKFEELSISFIHNYVFYFELLCKTYLQLNNSSFKYTHDLEYLLNLINASSKLKNLEESFFVINMNDRIKDIYESLLIFAGENNLETIQTKLKYGEFTEGLCFSAETDFKDIQINIFLDVNNIEAIFDNRVYDHT